MIRYEGTKFVKIKSDIKLLSVVGETYNVDIKLDIRLLSVIGATCNINECKDITKS